MDEEKLPGRLRAIVMRALDEAARRGAGTVEAEHLLLAIASGAGGVSETLAHEGLDYDSIDAALKAERAHGLAAAGVTPVDATQLASTPRRSRPNWGASVRDAMSRAHRGSARDRHHHGRMAEAELAVGILRAKLGTVPRALSLAGIDREAVIKRLQLERRL